MEHPTHQPEKEGRQPNELEDISPQEVVLRYIGRSTATPEDDPEERARVQKLSTQFEALPKDNPAHAAAVYREFACHHLDFVRQSAAIHIDLLYAVEPAAAGMLWVHLMNDHDLDVHLTARESIDIGVENGHLSEEEAAVLTSLYESAEERRALRRGGRPEQM